MEVERHDAVASEAERRRLRRRDLLEHHDRRGQEHGRDGELEHHQRLPHARAAASARRRAAQGGGGAEACQHGGGVGAREQAGREHESHGGEPVEHAEVAQGDALLEEGVEGGEGERRERDGDRAGGDAQYERLGEKAARELGAPGAERLAHAHLSRALGRLRRGQRGVVDACQEQHQAGDGSQQEVEQRPTEEGVRAPGEVAVDQARRQRPELLDRADHRAVGREEALHLAVQRQRVGDLGEADVGRVELGEGVLELALEALDLGAAGDQEVELDRRVRRRVLGDARDRERRRRGADDAEAGPLGLDDLPDRVGVAKERVRQRLRQERRAGLGERLGGAAREREREHVEEPGLGEPHRLDVDGLRAGLAPHQDGRVARRGEGLDARQASQHLGPALGELRKRHLAVAELHPLPHLDDALGALVEAVERELVAREEERQEAARQAHGQAAEVDGGRARAAAQAADGVAERLGEHRERGAQRREAGEELSG